MSATAVDTATPRTSTPAVVTLTEPAVRHLTGMLADDPENAGKSLRIFVEAGGCSGLQYGMVFDEKRDDDLAITYPGVGVVVDPFSAEYLRGAVIDFSEELTGGGFKINNPNAQSSCGCGKSFHT
jgi:iron-sulfur cluster assembly accessory protein